MKKYPRYQIISQAQIEEIHEQSLKIMEEIGIVFTYEPALEVFRKHGANVDGNYVKFPRAMVEAAIKSTPNEHTLVGRTADKNVVLNTEEFRTVGPYGSPFVTDIDKGRRVGTIEDFNNFAKICHSLDNIDIQSHIYCEPCDLGADYRHLEMIYSAIKYNTKPIMGSVLGYEASKNSIELAAIAHGGLSELKGKVIMSSIPTTLTPLSYDDKMAGAIMAYAEYGQSQLISSLCMAGATTPVTIAGTVSLQNAEVLAGIVLAQLVNPGTPIVYSASSTAIDMRTGGLAVGAPEDALFSLINGQLLKFYDIPCRISGALSDSKCVDAQAGYETMMTLMMAQLAGGNFILHSAGILEAYNCTSYEKLIVDNEVIGMIRRIGRGVDINEETMAYDVIKEVGPQGAFLDNEHTFMNFRDEIYNPQLSDRSAYQNWKNNGCQSAEQRANAQWKKILEEYVEPTLPADVEKDMRKFIESHK